MMPTIGAGPVIFLAPLANATSRVRSIPALWYSRSAVIDWLLPVTSTTVWYLLGPAPFVT